MHVHTGELSPKKRRTVPVFHLAVDGNSEALAPRCPRRACSHSEALEGRNSLSAPYKACKVSSHYCTRRRRSLRRTPNIKFCRLIEHLAASVLDFAAVLHDSGRTFFSALHKSGSTCSALHDTGTTYCELRWLSWPSNKSNHIL